MTASSHRILLVAPPMRPEQVYGSFSDWERTNALDEVVDIPGGLAPQILRHYSNLCYNACYLRAGNLLTLHRRLPTREHAWAFGRSVWKMAFKRGLLPMCQGA